VRNSAEIVVVGGGVIGLAVARALAKRDLSDLLLIERAAVGREASYAAAGIIAPQAEADALDDFYKLAAASRDLYPVFANELKEETGIDVELDLTGTLYLALTADDEVEIENRFTWQTKAGLPVERLAASDALSLEPCISKSVRAALLFPLDSQVENRRLVEALAQSCRQQGIAVSSDTAVTSLRTKSGRVVGVETSRGFIAADKVIVAAGAWTSRIKGLPAIPIEPVRGHMLCLRNEPMARHVIYSPRGYLVPRRDGRLLAGSTLERAGFDKTVTAAALDAIRSRASEICPRLSELAQIDSWAGLRPCATDNLPVIGPCGEIEGLVYATGHYRNGILLAPVTGELVATVVVDKVLPALLAPFTADRFGLVASNASC
jgi:glycine oxidase